MMTSITFSQIDTQKRVILTEEIAKQVIVDLLIGDQAIEEVKMLNHKITLYDSKFKIQENHIGDLDLKIEILEDKIEIHKKQFNLSQEQNSNLKNQLNQQNLTIKKQKVTFIGILAAIIGGVLLLTK